MADTTREAPMQNDGILRETLAASGLHPREIYEMAYLKHKTGASEADIRAVMEKVGQNRAKIERELGRLKVVDRT
jgi:hypothetical protein